MIFRGQQTTAKLRFPGEHSQAIAWLGVLAAFFLTEAKGSSFRYSKPVRYAVEHSYEVNNFDIKGFNSIEVNVPIPQSWPEQSVEHIQYLGDPMTVLKDLQGRGQIYRFFEDRKFPDPGQSIKGVLRYEVVLKELSVDVQRLLHQKIVYPENTENKIYLPAEKGLEVDAPEIMRLAGELKKKNPHPVAYAQAAYDWILENIRYECPSPSHGALECLHKKLGDCGPQAGLFVALCRAGGLPARPVAGCWAGAKNGWHCWAEFLVPAEGWVPVDPTVLTGKQSAGMFGRIDNNRLALVKSYNLKFGATRGTRESGFIQPGSWFYYVHGGVTGSKIEARFNIIGKRDN